MIVGVWAHSDEDGGRAIRERIDKFMVVVVAEPSWHSVAGEVASAASIVLVNLVPSKEEIRMVKTAAGSVLYYCSPFCFVVWYFANYS